MAVDGAGNLYIAEHYQCRVRKVDSNGTITTLAGTGDCGYSGDGGPAEKARLMAPNDVAVDGTGNVYIAFWLPVANQSPVRKVDSTGTITTIPGEFMSDVVAVDGAGNLYIVDSNPTSATVGVVRKVDTAGSITTVAGIERMTGITGDGVRAVETPLPQVFDLAVDDAGNLYIAAGHSVHKVDSEGIITTVAGWKDEFEGNWDGSGDGVPAVGAPLNGAIAVAVDRAGNLYIADKHKCRIRRVDSTGTINTIAGGECGKDSWAAGQVVEGVFRDMEHVAVDRAGNLYVADGIRILKVHP